MSERRLAPQVCVSLLKGERAYLLGWERRPASEGGGWGARIAWIEMTEEGAWLARGGVVPADSVQPVPGQDYSRVPRDPRPRDPSDPRDAGHQDQGHEGRRPGILDSGDDDF